MNNPIFPIVSLTAKLFLSLSTSLLPTPSTSKVAPASSDDDTVQAKVKVAKVRKVHHRFLLARASSFNRKIAHGVAMNSQRAFEEMEKHKDELIDLQKAISSSENANLKSSLNSYSNYLWKIVHEDLPRDAADDNEAKFIKAIGLNKNILSLMAHGEEIERKLARGWDLRRSMGNKAMRELSKKIDVFTWDFAKKIGSDWQKTIEEAKSRKDEMNKLKALIEETIKGKSHESHEIIGKLKNYLYYLEKILKEDVTATVTRDNVMDVTRAIQENLLDMIHHWKELKGGLKNPHGALFAKSLAFNRDVGSSVAMHSQMALEELEKRRSDFTALLEEAESANKKLKNKKMKKSLNRYSTYLWKVVNDDLSGEPAEDYEAKSIKAIKLNKNILSLMVRGEKVENNFGRGGDWRESIEDENLRKLTRNLERFTWNFAEKIGLGWERTMEEAEKFRGKMGRLETQISAISKEAAHSGSEYAKRLGNYSHYLGKILNEDLPAYKTTDRTVAMEVTRATQRNLLHMINQWKEYKGILKK